MPIDYKRYPPDWTQISLRIRTERAQNRCEWCGLANGALGYRDPDGRFWTDAQLAITFDGNPGMKLRHVRIVLTVAHLGTPHADGRPGDKHDKMDVREENLAALCQSCHLNYDRADHIHNAAVTRRLNKIRAGQLALFEESIAS